MEELKASMKQRAIYGMIASFTILPLVLVDKSEAKDLDELMNKDGYTNPGHQNLIYKKIMSKRMLKYDEWGLLDI